MLKLLSCVTTAGCVICGPIGVFYSFPGNEVDEAEKVLPIVKLAKKNPLILKNSSGRGGLSLTNMEKFFESEGKEVSFKDLDIKFGDYKLQKDDLLASPRQDGQYYLAKYVSSGQYRLENDQVVRAFNRWDSNFSSLNHVKIRFYTYGNVSRTFSPSTISVGTCTFTRRQLKVPSNEWKIVVQCRDAFKESIWGVLDYNLDQQGTNS